MTETNESNLGSVDMNQHVRYLGKGHFIQRLATHTHSGLTAKLGPL